MLEKIKYLLVGSPLPNWSLADRRLNKLRALAAFSPDALSSLAYANQEIYLGLVVAGSAGLAMQVPIAVAITALLVIVALSYAQTIRVYPSGGGSYVVARENLGQLPGLVTGAALMVSYVLTAAVSLTAGVAALSSAFPGLYPFRVQHCPDPAAAYYPVEYARVAGIRYGNVGAGLRLCSLFPAHDPGGWGAGRIWAGRCPSTRAGFPGLPAYEFVSIAACFCIRLYRPYRYRSHQQRGAQFQAA